jgi:hypothetical protein
MSWAEIVNINGDSILEWAWQGNSQLPKAGWPAQSKPPKSDWVIWQIAIRQVMGDGKGISERGQVRKLRQSLGPWFSNTKTEWEYHSTSDTLYHCSGEETTAHQRIPGRHSRQSLGGFSLEGSLAECPPDTSIAECSKENYRINMKAVTARKATIEDNRGSLLDRLQQEPKEYDWLRDSMAWPLDEGREIAQSISQGTCIAVSDGSFKEGHGTASAIIIGNSTQIRCDVVTPGISGVQCSYRSELAGLFAAVYHIDMVCQHYQVTEGKVLLACDGESALNQIRWW